MTDQEYKDAEMEVLIICQDLFRLDLAGMLRFMGERTDSPRTRAMEGVVAALRGAQVAAVELRDAIKDEKADQLREAMSRQLAEEIQRLDTLTPDKVAARKAS